MTHDYQDMEDEVTQGETYREKGQRIPGTLSGSEKQKRAQERK